MDDKNQKEEPVNGINQGDHFEQDFQNQAAHTNMADPYQQTDANEQADSNQQYQQTDANQQYQQTGANQQYQQTGAGQQYQQTDANWQYQQTGPGQRYQQYGPYTQYSQYQKKEDHSYSSGFGIASMILGILSLVLFCTCINVPMAVAAVIFGILQLGRGRQGRGMAITGLVTAVLSVIALIVTIALLWRPFMEYYRNALSDVHHPGYDYDYEYDDDDDYDDFFDFFDDRDHF